jgi:SAM-dependent methyltransferase
MELCNNMNDVLVPSKEEALAAWASRVRRNRDQAERFREAPEQSDFYGATSGVFKVDPLRSDDPSLDILSGLARPGETWLDIGAGGGRYALPIARKVQEVIAVEPSLSMSSLLLQSREQYGIRNIRIIQDRWPLKELPRVDVSLISHVGYDIENIGPFLDAMEASSRRLCVAVLLDAAPTALADVFWPSIHNEKRAALPALREFLILQIARGRLCEVRLTTRGPQTYPGREMALSFIRQQLFIEPGGEKDRLLQPLLDEHLKKQGGQFSLMRGRSLVGIVSWKGSSSPQPAQVTF